jgi:predicted acyltransferase
MACRFSPAQTIKVWQLRPMRYVELSAAVPTRRVVSVDALRGLNMFFIIGFDGAMGAVAVMSRNKGAAISTIGSFLGTQFTHSEWEGFRFYDFIFPLFVFVTGVSIVLSLPRLVEQKGKARAHLRVLRRALVLYVLGVLAYGGISQHWADVRLLGVLQRIAICYLFASLMFLNFNLRGMIAAFVVLLVGYWALLTFVPLPGSGPGSYAPDANLANWLDYYYLPGRLWDITRDPEGMLSTLPAIGTCLLGVFAGLLLRGDGLSPQRKTLWLLIGGLVLLATGYLWARQFPIVKAIWTSSFVLVAGGYSLILLAALHQIVDVWKWQRWATIFIWIGANAIGLYFLNEVLGFEPFATRLVGGDFANLLDRVITEGAGQFFAHALGIAFAIALAGFLYHRKIFLRV